MNKAWSDYVDSRPIKSGNIGYCLDDKRNPPRLYEVDSYIDYGIIEVILLEDHSHRMNGRHIPDSDFWVVLDRL